MDRRRQAFLPIFVSAADSFVMYAGGTADFSMTCSGIAGLNWELPLVLGVLAAVLGGRDLTE